MTTPPRRPKIYHITHVDNLPGIIREGCLVSDAAMFERGGPQRAIGMSNIKRRRVEELDIDCHPGTKVGDYVPFYFCSRSVMLYVIHRANHPELDYRGGQGPIVHLEADLRTVVRWADGSSVPWAFSLSNAGARYTEFRSRLDDLDHLDWEAIATRDFRAPRVKESKQAEFLILGRFPLGLVERFGVHSEAMRARVDAAVPDTGSRPDIEVRPDWYF